MAMDLKESPQEMWDKPQITIDMVRPHIQAFSEGLTGVQWELLESGKPDEATKFALAELLLNLITTLTGVLVKQLKSNVCISEELVLDSISEPVSQGFAEVLNISLCSSFRSSSLEKLTSSLGEEVTVSVNTTQLLSSSSPPRSKRVTPTNKLNKMVSYACKLLKKFAGKMKTLCCVRKVRVSIADLEVEITSQSSSSKESVMGEKIKSVNEIIKKEVSEITDVILDVLPDAEYTLLQSQSSLEIKNAADAIFRFAVKTEQAESEGTSPKRINSAGSVKRRIKNFIVETFGKAYIHRIVAQTRARFYPTATAKSKEELQALSASIDVVLLTKGDANQNRSSANNLTLTQELSDLLYTHITPPTYNNPYSKDR